VKWRESMAKYYLTFSKLDDMKYISHLDLLRLFKRAFKSADIRLGYSEGFNPHPKLAFGQPLSLGYESLEEWLEFETKVAYEGKKLNELIDAKLPGGITIGEVTKAPKGRKPLAATCYEADYRITINQETCLIDVLRLKELFLKQSEILVSKESKKTKEIKSINIQPMIKSFELEVVDDNIVMTTTLDAGSQSNLSPELLLQAFLRFSQISVPRHEIDVMRTALRFRD
jgi:radical SAM-linked protein